MRNGPIKGTGPAAIEARLMRLEHQPSPQAATEHGLRLWQILSIEGSTCTVRLCYDGTNLIASSEMGGILYDAVHMPSVGDQGLLIRLSNGALRFFMGGGGAVVAGPDLAKALVSMTADNTAYNCVFLNASGGIGAAVTARRPPGVYVTQNMIGTLGKDNLGQNIFYPLFIYVENRTSDPAVPVTGQMWLRTDL